MDNKIKINKIGPNQYELSYTIGYTVYSRLYLMPLVSAITHFTHYIQAMEQRNKIILNAINKANKYCH